MELEADGRSWFEAETDDLMEEFEGMSADTIARELESNAEAYDGGYVTALSVAAALRRRTVAYARGKIGPAVTEALPAAPASKLAKRCAATPSPTAPDLFH